MYDSHLLKWLDTPCLIYIFFICPSINLLFHFSVYRLHLSMYLSTSCFCLSLSLSLFISLPIFVFLIIISICLSQLSIICYNSYSIFLYPLNIKFVRLSFLLDKIVCVSFISVSLYQRARLYLLFTKMLMQLLHFQVKIKQDICNLKFVIGQKNFNRKCRCKCKLSSV